MATVTEKLIYFSCKATTAHVVFQIVHALLGKTIWRPLKLPGA